MTKTSPSVGTATISPNKYLGVASATINWKDALEDFFSRVREEFIFDNLVIYQTESDTRVLEVLFAKSIGRGKSAEADVSWGETISNRVIQESRIICEEPEADKEEDRLKMPFMIALPVTANSKLPGVLVFIRFGGPAFSAQDIEYARWAVDQITSMIRHKLLNEYMEKVEKEKSVSNLQSDFISTISHELRSPLGFIKGYTTTLLRTDTDWDRATQKDFLEIIERETNNLTDLIEDLLDSSRLQSGHMKFDFYLVRIDSLLRDEVNRLHLTHPQQQIELDFDPDIPAIEGDPRKLAQVFDNLLSNEIKYAPDAEVIIKLRKSPDHLEIDFCDNGPGIPERDQPKIFTRFFRVPEHTMKAHGSGLGLFICKQIIENHEGSIKVSSSAQGTIFTILLPLKITGVKTLPEDGQ